MLVNLLEETINTLKFCSKSPEDVIWVGNSTGWFTWDEFAKLANKEYDNDYGCVEVDFDLIIVGNNWWLERQEYNGSEWWDFKVYPQKPEKHNIPKTLFADDTLLTGGEIE